MTAEATRAGGAIVGYISPAAHDAVDGDGVATCSPASGSNFPLGATQVRCVATDVAGNTASSFFDVFVVDTTPPTIDPHANVTVEATGASGAVVSYTSPASLDAVGGDGVASCSQPPPPRLRRVSPTLGTLAASNGRSRTPRDHL